VKPPGGTHAYLSDELGVTLAEAVEELVARMPTPQETITLRLVPGTPVVELVRTIYDDNNNPVEVTVFVIAAAATVLSTRYRWTDDA
jgi:GntR family transcriptional regulator